MKKQRDADLLLRIGEQLKELRRKKGLTQEDVYSDTKKNIGLYEIGATNLTIDTMKALCNYYNITLEEFFRESEL